MTSSAHRTTPSPFRASRAPIRTSRPRGIPRHDGASCATFEDTVAAVSEGHAKYAAADRELLAGRIGDIHHLLPESGLYIVGEHFLRIRFHLLGLKGAKIEGLKSVQSQPPALGQCRKIIRELGLSMVVGADTAGSARQVAEAGDPSCAAIATGLAAEIYGLEILRADIEDETHNTTRFLIMAKEPNDAEPEDEPVVTSFVFRVRNVPAALYLRRWAACHQRRQHDETESYQLEGT